MHETKLQVGNSYQVTYILLALPSSLSIYCEFICNLYHEIQDAANFIA